MVESLLWLDIRTEDLVVSDHREATILVHHDDVTPDRHVIFALQVIFGLSDELAEHITWVAHTRGIARVATHPRNLAESLVSKAHIDARLYGFPLTFSLEEVVSTPKADLRKDVLRPVICGIALFLALLVAVSLATADGAGDFAAHGIVLQPQSKVVRNQVGSSCRAVLEELLAPCPSTPQRGRQACERAMSDYDGEPVNGGTFRNRLPESGYDLYARCYQRLQRESKRGR